MSDNQAKIKGNRRRGRPPKSGAYSPICRAEFLEEYPEIRRNIQAARDGLVMDQLERHGGKSEDDLSTASRLMIDRQVSKVALSQQIEIYIRRHGILRRDQLKRRQILEPEPILVFWLQLQNSIDRALIALGLEKRVIEPEMNLAEIVREIDEKAAAEKAQREAAGQEDQGKEAGEGEIGEPRASGEEISGGQGEGHE